MGGTGISLKRECGREEKVRIEPRSCGQKAARREQSKSLGGIGKRRNSDSIQNARQAKIKEALPPDLGRKASAKRITKRTC